AERRASYSAKAEFFKALWLMAQALDGPANDRHVAALTAATRALDEAEDFAPQAGRLDAPVEVKLVVGGHRTPALKSMPLERITPRMALDRYLVFAQQKLAEAVDGQAVGSKALYLLGRLHTVVAQDRTPCFAAAEQKALAFQQAAMSADPNNFLAANELGVLLARAGRHEEARTILQHCAALAPRPEVWHNLVVVHRNLGEIALAQEAQQHLIAAQTRQPAAIRKPRPAEMVRWVEPAEFAQAGPVPAAAAIPPRASETPVAPAAVESSAKPSAGPLGWFAWPGRQSR
ncbi:MAG: tetratricopeptide repeat protein, partial [Planctomycetes bacterium]|nr:tetratricopeptide repeat protein [Planctomycetota bacterium]